MKDIGKSKSNVSPSTEGIAQSVFTHHTSSSERAEDRRFKSFPRNIDLHIIVEEETKEDYKEAYAVNDPDPDDDNSYRRWLINVYVGEHNYRKNVNYKRVAEDINNLFLLEYICAITRKNTENFGTLCNNKYPLSTCPCEAPLIKGMRLKIK